MSDLRRSQRLRATLRNQQSEHNKKPHSAPVAVPRNKRKDDSDDLPDEIKPPKRLRLRLTKENLRRHQQVEHPSDNREIIRRSKKTPSSASKTTITTTDKQFGRKLRGNGVVYDSFDTLPPDDVATLRAALSKEQDIPLTAQEYWEQLCEATRQNALSESSLESMIVESMFISLKRPFNYQRYRNDAWTETDNEITVGISDPKPDVVEAYTWSAYPPDIQDDFVELAPSAYGYSMPTFAMESKGAGSHARAVKQAAYDGAIMTCTAIAIEEHVGKSGAEQLRKTKAITMTLSSEEIDVYANHAVVNNKGKRLYHQYRLAHVLYAESEEMWRKAHNLVFNARAIALGLAKSRVQMLWDYSKAEEAKQEQIKTRNARLQKEARAKTKAVMAPPPSRRLKTKVKDQQPEKQSQAETRVTMTPPSSDTPVNSG